MQSASSVGVGGMSSIGTGGSTTITQEVESVKALASSVATLSHTGGIVSIVFTVSAVALVDVVVRFENFPWAPRTRVCGAGSF